MVASLHNSRDNSVIVHNGRTDKIKEEKMGSTTDGKRHQIMEAVTATLRQKQIPITKKVFEAAAYLHGKGSYITVGNVARCLLASIQRDGTQGTARTVTAQAQDAAVSLVNLGADVTEANITALINNATHSGNPQQRYGNPPNFPSVTLN